MRRKLTKLFIRMIKRNTAYESQVTSHAQAGFTLTEVVVASTVLIIAIVPILRALTSAQVTSTIIEHRTRSLTLAQAKLDEIKARSIYNYGDDFTETNSSLDGPYLCNVVDSFVSANLRTITVSVGYDHNGNSTLETDEIEITLATLVARRW
ncbi:hypothetical protein ES703_25397 [subsurface metagenome]